MPRYLATFTAIAFLLSAAATSAQTSWSDGGLQSLAGARDMHRSIGVSHPPDIYTTEIDLFLGLTANEGSAGDLVYRFATAPWRRVQGPLRLSAAPGEVRTYTIEIGITQELAAPESAPEEPLVLEYQIDRRPPPPPVPTAPPGLYTERPDIEFARHDGSRILYTLDGKLSVYDGTPVQIDVGVGEYRRAKIVAQSIDRFGRVSEPRSYTYIVDRRPLPAPSRSQQDTPLYGDLSPPDVALFHAPWHAPGTIAHDGDPRLLVVLKGQSGTELFYSLDESDPDAASTPVPREGAIITRPPAGGTGVEVPSIRARAVSHSGELGPEAVLKLPSVAPPPPRIHEDLDEPGVIVLRPEHPDAEYRYELRTDGTQAPLAGRNSPLLQPETRIMVSPGETRSISYSIVHIDDNGMSSQATVSELRTLSYQLPEAPALQVLADGTLNIQGEGVLFYRVAAHEPDVRTLIDNLGWKRYDGPLRVPAIDGRRSTFRIESYAVSRHGVRSAVSTTTATIDLRTPHPMLLEYTRPVERPYKGDAVLSFLQYDQDLQLRYEVYQNDAAIPLLAGIARPGGELRIEAPAHPERVEYRVILHAAYPDSTRAPFQAERTLVIDTRGPAAPAVQHPVHGKTYTGSMHASIEPELGDSAVIRLFRVTDTARQLVADDVPPHETFFVSRYGSGSFELETELTNAAGIRTRLDAVAFVLQRFAAPDPAPQSSIARGEDTATVFLWHDLGRSLLYGPVASGQPADWNAVELREYLTPISFRTDSPPDAVLFAILPSMGVEYLPEQIRLSNLARPEPARFAEITQNGLYNKTRILERESREGLQLRFELMEAELTDIPNAEAEQTMPTAPTVSSISPLLESSIRLDPGPNADRRYHLRAAWFDGSTRVTPETIVQFRIDRVPPDPPTVVGVQPFAHIDTVAELRLEPADSGDELLYRFIEDNTPLSQPPVFSKTKTEESLLEKLTPYTGEPLSFRVAPGEYRAVKIEAYSRDQAGNLSTNFTELQFIVDRAVVYLDAQNNQSETGSREAPFRNLASAFELAVRDNRSLILVGPGIYTLNQTLSLGRPTGESSDLVELELRGVSELPLPAEDIVLSRPDNGDASGRNRPHIDLSHQGAFRVEAVPLKLTNLQLSSRSGSEYVVFDTRGPHNPESENFQAMLELSGVEIRLSGATRALLVSTGRVSVHDSALSSLQVRGGPFVQVDSGELEFLSTRIELRGSNTTYRGIDVGPTATLNLRDSTAFARPLAGLYTNIFSTGTVQIHGSRFDLSGAQGLVGLRAADGRVNLQDCEFELYGAAEFAYGLFLAASESTVNGAHLRVAGSLDDAAIVQERGVLHLADARLELAEARGRSTGLRLSGGQAELNSVDIVLHRIAAPGQLGSRPDNNVAVALDAVDRNALRFDGLTIAGFPILLRPPRTPGVLRAPAAVRSPEELRAYFGIENSLNLQLYEDSSQLSW